MFHSYCMWKVKKELMALWIRLFRVPKKKFLAAELGKLRGIKDLEILGNWWPTPVCHLTYNCMDLGEILLVCDVYIYVS